MSGLRLRRARRRLAQASTTRSRTRRSWCPSLLFPLFFFTAFAGGLSRVADVPGLRLPGRLHGVPVRLRPPPVGGVRRRLQRLRDRPRLRERLRPAAAARGAAADGDHRRLRAGRARALGGDGARSSSSSRCIAGMEVLGDPVELFGLVLLGLLRQRGGGAVGRRDRHALPHDPGRPADADAGLPDPLPRARLRAARPAHRLDPRRRLGQPGHVLLEAGRGLISGEPVDVALGFAIALGLPSSLFALLGAARPEERRVGRLAPPGGRVSRGHGRGLTPSPGRCGQSFGLVVPFRLRTGPSLLPTVAVRLHRLRGPCPGSDPGRVRLGHALAAELFAGGVRLLQLRRAQRTETSGAFVNWMSR